MTDSPPLVSVITPVYNGARYLAEAIESVLRQTFTNWRYTIVDNRSDDETGEIARRYAELDPRISIVETPEFLPVIANWNFSVQQLPPSARYCKILHADDLLLPNCLEEMVAAGEEYPCAGIIGAYALYGTRMKLTGIPKHVRLIPGNEICREFLLDGVRVFGSPSALLLRADLIRSRPQLYDERELHADHALCLELLQDSDFAFVHQVLTYNRVHDDSITAGFANRMRTARIAEIAFLRKYGPVFLSDHEWRTQLKKRRKRYYKGLASRLLSGSRREVWKYHSRRLEEIGEPLNLGYLLLTATRLGLGRLVNPRTFGRKRVTNSHDGVL